MNSWSNITTTHVHTVNNDLSINTSKQKQLLTPTTHSIHTDALISHRPAAC